MTTKEPETVFDILDQMEPPQQTVAKANPAPGQEVSLLNVIASASTDPKVDVAKLEKLLDMYERVQKREAELEFNSAMVDVQARAPKVIRNQENSQTSSMYADLEAVADALVPIHTAAGLSLSFGTDNSPHADHLRIVCDVAHTRGHCRRYFYDLPYDKAGIAGKTNKTDLHASGSTVTYGRRYLMAMIFNIATTDDDGNAAGDVITTEQAVELDQLWRAVKANKEKFLAYMGAEDVQTIQARDFYKAKNMLLAKKKQNEEEEKKRKDQENAGL